MMRRRVYTIMIPVVLAGLAVGQCTSKPTGPSAGVADFPNTVGSHWTYELTTERITASDSSVSIDTVTATISEYRVLANGLTEASVWIFEPRFIDIYEVTVETLFVVSLGYDTRYIGDTVRMYRRTDQAGPSHTISLKRYVPPEDVTIRSVSCNESPTTGEASVYVPAGEYDATYTATAFCVGLYFDWSMPEPIHVQHSRTLYFQPRVGFVQIRQSRIDSNGHTVRHTWRLLSYHIAAP